MPFTQVILIFPCSLNCWCCSLPCGVGSAAHHIGSDSAGGGGGSEEEKEGKAKGETAGEGQQ